MQEVELKNRIKSEAKPSLKPGLLRRLAAVFYDAILLLAVLFFATALALPFNSGQAYSAESYLFTSYLLIVAFCFYCWFWINGGQTLGLKAWKMQVCRFEGGRLSWAQAGTRFFAAMLSWLCFGLGFLWCLIDKNGLCWHDHLSKTHVCLLNQEKD